MADKRVYRIYRELELNLRIKLRKRLKREKKDDLAVLEAPNEIGPPLRWQRTFARFSLAAAQLPQTGRL
ncbi:hypothetical protein [Leisingera aquaemixtae]|uniref:hypothetical protein n=1 Tax=Leisingera aquaemixtae TaxID=1396826 RepID=UPI0035CCE942